MGKAKGTRCDALQKALICKGANIDADGIYGKKTEETVRQLGVLQRVDKPSEAHGQITSILSILIA